MPTTRPPVPSSPDLPSGHQPSVVVGVSLGDAGADGPGPSGLGENDGSTEPPVGESLGRSGCGSGDGRRVSAGPDGGGVPSPTRVCTELPDAPGLDGGGPAAVDGPGVPGTCPEEDGLAEPAVVGLADPDAPGVARDGAVGATPAGLLPVPAVLPTAGAAERAVGPGVASEAGTTSGAEVDPGRGVPPSQPPCCAAAVPPTSAEADTARPHHSTRRERHCRPARSDRADDCGRAACTTSATGWITTVGSSSGRYVPRSAGGATEEQEVQNDAGGQAAGDRPSAEPSAAPSRESRSAAIDRHVRTATSAARARRTSWASS